MSTTDTGAPATLPPSPTFGSYYPAVIARAQHRQLASWRDTERWCERLGIPFVKPDPFPQNGVPAARIALALPEEARPAFTRAVFRAEFCEGRAIDDEKVLRDAVMAAGSEYETALETAKTDLVKDALRKETDEAGRLGIFGAPMLVTSDGELFWGNDRLEEALDWERSRG